MALLGVMDELPDALANELGVTFQSEGFAQARTIATDGPRRNLQDLGDLTE